MLDKHNIDKMNELGDEMIDMMTNNLTIQESVALMESLIVGLFISGLKDRNLEGARELMDRHKSHILNDLEKEGWE